MMNYWGFILVVRGPGPIEGYASVLSSVFNSMLINLTSEGGYAYFSEVGRTTVSVSMNEGEQKSPGYVQGGGEAVAYLRS